MKTIMNRFLTSALSAFALGTSLTSLDAAFVEETPTTVVTVGGTYTGIYLHGTASVKMGEGLFPFSINVTLEPTEGAKTKFTVVCGEGETRFIAGTPGTDHPKLFPTFLESDPQQLLQLEDPTLSADKKKVLHILTAYRGMPVVFKLTFSNLIKPAAGGAPNLTVTGNGHERFAISKIVSKGGELVAKSLLGHESVLPSLDFTLATKTDIVEFFRKLASLIPAALAAFSIDSKTTATGTETTFSVKVNN